MGMKVYRAGRVDGDGKRRGRILRPTLLVLLVLLVLLLIYLLVPLGGQRVVLLGSDARGDEVSRSDTIVVTRAGGGMLAVPRDTLVDIPGEGNNPIHVGIDGRRVSIPAGTQELNGLQALAFVRYRGGPTADIGRIGRQQKFLKELARQ